MTIDMGKLDRGIRNAKREIYVKTLDGLKKVATQVDQALVLATPRDTGRAANNWIPNINGPSSQYRKDAKGGTSGILAEGQRVIKGAKLGDSIHFTNNTPYIGPLNNGHSKQAPAGFVEKAVQAGKASLKGKL